jgi:hypothetical protein
MKTRARHLRLYATLALTMLSGCLDAMVGEPFECEVEGKLYQAGDSFLGPDGCNTCSCGSNGEIACTERACIPPSDGGTGDARATDAATSDGGICRYGGVGYVEGQRFAADDGCNSCVCTSEGVECTLLECSPRTCAYGGRTYAFGSTFPATDGCNSCSCHDGNVACTEKACSMGCLVDGVIYEAGKEIPMSSKGVACYCGMLGEVICQKSCTYGNGLYRSGQSFPSSDGCNSCTCSDGEVSCTAAACVTCMHNGKLHRPGETFPDADGCNSCTCGMDGLVACTARACEPTSTCQLGSASFANGSSVTCEDGCNVCLCAEGTWSSTDAACPPLPAIKPCTPSAGMGTWEKIVYLSKDALAVETSVNCDMVQTPPELCWEAFLESEPVQARLRMQIPQSSCTTSSTRTFVYDLAPMREAYRQGYQTTQGTIDVTVGMSSATYTF